MKNDVLLLVGIIGLVFISGCTEQIGGVNISLKNVSADKAVYHSSDLMNLTVAIYSESDLENVTVAAEGINGRLNTEKTVDLKKGINEVSFTYTLPRCNVCGGISAGDYNMVCTVRYKNITIEDSTIINIQQ